MTRHLLGLAAGVLLTAGLGCVSDPTESLVGDIAGVQTSLSVVEVDVGDSVLVTAETKDSQGNVLTVVPEVTSQDPGVIAVSLADVPPMPTRRFYLRGVSYGTGEVLVSAGDASATIEVTTFPGRVVVTGAPDTLGSGATAQLTPEPQDVSGNPITVNDQFFWASSDTNIVVIDSLTGLASAKAPGRATITVTAPGGAEGTADIVVAAGVFAGTLSQTAGDPGDAVVVVAQAGGPTFDADTQVRLGTAAGTVAVWVTRVVADTLYLVMPATGATGLHTLSIFNMGPGQLAQNADYTSNDAFSDPWVGSDDAGTAPSYVANRSPLNNFLHFVHGGFGSGAGSRGILNGGADPDHYFAITTGASGATLTEIRVEWTDGSDVDVYVCYQDMSDCPNTGFSGSTSNEIVTNVTLDANTTYVIVASVWTGGSNTTNMRLRINGTGFN